MQRQDTQWVTRHYLVTLVYLIEHLSEPHVPAGKWQAKGVEQQSRKLDNQAIWLHSADLIPRYDYNRKSTFLENILFHEMGLWRTRGRAWHREPELTQPRSHRIFASIV